MDYACKVDYRVQACMAQQGSSPAEMPQSLATANAQMLPGQPQQLPTDYLGIQSHEAVVHVEDELINHGTNVIVSELQHRRQGKRIESKCGLIEV